jgi:oligopeptide transport system ATP-binding protein
MYLGRIVEEGPTEAVFADPQHPYTRLLLSSIPRLHGAPLVAPDTPDPGAVRQATGCRFAPRCPQAQPVCTAQDPALIGPDPERLSACHFSFGQAPAVLAKTAAGHTQRGTT